MAAVTELEAGLVSEWTKVALAAAKQRGVQKIGINLLRLREKYSELISITPRAGCDWTDACCTNKRIRGPRLRGNYGFL
jgi:hypothetical protein